MSPSAACSLCAQMRRLWMKKTENHNQRIAHRYINTTPVPYLTNTIWIFHIHIALYSAWKSADEMLPQKCDASARCARCCFRLTHNKTRDEISCCLPSHGFRVACSTGGTYGGRMCAFWAVLLGPSLRSSGQLCGVVFVWPCTWTLRTLVVLVAANKSSGVHAIAYSGQLLRCN